MKEEVEPVDLIAVPMRERNKGSVYHYQDGTEVRGNDSKINTCSRLVVWVGMTKNGEGDDKRIISVKIQNS